MDECAAHFKNNSWTDHDSNSHVLDVHRCDGGSHWLWLVFPTCQRIRIDCHGNACLHNISGGDRCAKTLEVVDLAMCACLYSNGDCRSVIFQRERDEIFGRGLVHSCDCCRALLRDLVVVEGVQNVDAKLGKTRSKPARFFGGGESHRRASCAWNWRFSCRSSRRSTPTADRNVSTIRLYVRADDSADCEDRGHAVCRDGRSIAGD